ncbi:hypothetical protein [Labilibaculum sp.]|uniref:hypothetical protein n=1 Tax=Labilibaculum sp. TaxID=2060723 RepID=UPI0035641E89
MSKKEEIYQDNFIRKLMKDVELEEPSDQFTNKVMDGVMQDWLAKPIEISKPVSKSQWIWMSGLIFILGLILLGTDVRTLISQVDNTFLAQVDVLFLQPLHQILFRVAQSLIQLPILVYIIAVSLGVLVVFDWFAKRSFQYR